MGRRPGLRDYVGLIAVVVSSIGLGSSTLDAAPPTDPADYLNAGGSAPPEELLYWQEQIPCPSIGDAEITTSGYVSADRVELGCSYRNDSGLAGELSITWSKLGAPPFQCGLESADLGYEIHVADPLLDATVQVRFPAAEFVDQLKASTEHVFELVRPRANPCAPPSGPQCPTVDGWQPMAFFGPSAQMDVATGDWNNEYKCEYALPAAAGEPGGVSMRLRVNAITVVGEGAASPQDVQAACSKVDWFEYGQGYRGTDHRFAATVEYSIDSPDPISLEPINSAISAVLDIAEPVAVPCTGVELLPTDPYSPIPAYLDGVFTPEVVSTPRPPIIASAALSPTEPTATSPATNPPAPADTAGSQSPPAASPQTTTPTSQATAVGEPEAATLQATAGWVTWSLRIVTVIALVLSVGSLLVAFLFLRRESKVRPRFDIARIVIMAIVGAAMFFIFSTSAPWWAVAIAISIGVVLGVLQGRSLVVRATERGLLARRGGVAVIAFLVGLVVSQIAGLLNRSGAVSLGIAMTIFSVALGVGLFVGRAPKLHAARAAALGVVLLALGAMFMPGTATITEAGTTPDDGRQPDGLGLGQNAVAPEDRSPAMDDLVDMVDWETIDLTGGLFHNRQKPPLTISVPRGVDTPPEPVTQSIAWSGDIAGSPAHYALTETFTFDLRADGFCCSVSYLAEGTQARGDSDPEPVALEAVLGDIQVVGVEGTGYSAGTFSSHVTGLPFTEISERNVASADGIVSRCERVVAETRSDRALEETGAAMQVISATPNVESNRLALQLTTDCEVPGFSLQAALEAAPAPPPIDDPARATHRSSGCPVMSELLDAVSSGSAMTGVDTATVGQLFINPNQNACDVGSLSSPITIGQGGAGQQRQEFAIEFAKPRLGEWDRGYGKWWPDPCCNLPATQVRPADDNTCAITDDGVAVEPDGYTEGTASCGLVTQHRIPEGEIWINTEYVLDGPNTEIRAELPWGAFWYRCHHCEPGDAEIAGFLGRIMAFGNDSAANIAISTNGSTEVVTTGPTATTITPATTPDGTLTPQTSQVDRTSETVPPESQEAEALVDLVLDDDATNAEREAAIAAVIGLLGAAAIGATSLADAGVGAGELFSTWRAGGADAVDGLIAERQRRDIESATDPPPDTGPPELVSAWDPNVDNGPDEPSGGWVRVSVSERERLEALDRGQRRGERLDRDAAELAEIRAEQQRHQTAVEAIQQDALDDLRREQLEVQQAINEAEADFWNDPTNWLTGVAIDTAEGIATDIANTPEAIYEVARRAGIAIREGLDAAAEELTDSENWQIAGETAAGTFRDAIGLAIGDDQAYDHFVDGGGQITDAGRVIATAIANDPQAFLEQMMAIDKLRAATDPDLPLADRFSNYGQFAAEVFIEWATAGGAHGAHVADAARAGEAIDDAASVGRAGRGLDLDDYIRNVERRVNGDVPSRLSDEAFAARRQSWGELNQRAVTNVDEFEAAMRDLDRVRASGSADDLVAAEQRATDAMLTVQADKRTLQEINLRSETTRAQFNQRLTSELYDPIDRRVLDDIASHQGFGQMGTEPVQVLGDGTRVFRDANGNTIELLAPTNPSDVPKVGADRDFTVRIRPHGAADATDVPHEVVEQIYHQELRNQVGDPARLGLPDDPRELANRLDQAMTDQFHPEAYTDLETILYDQSGALRDPQQIRLAMEHKGLHWTNQFADTPDAALAEDMMAEGMRQLGKQFGNQVQPRFDAMNDLRAAQGLDPLGMPDRLEASYRIVLQVNPKPPGRPSLSPVEAERLLNDLGTSVPKFADEMGAFLQAVEQSRSGL